MQETMDLGQAKRSPVAPVSTAALCRHLNRSERTIRELRAKGVIDCISPGRWDLDDCRIRFLEHLAEQAAGRYSEGDLNLNQEKAALAKEQRERIALENRKRRRELLEASIVLQRLTDIFVSVTTRLQAIPAKLAPKVGEEAARLFAEEQYEVLTLLATGGVIDQGADRGDEAGGSGPQKRARQDRSAPKDDRKRVGRKVPRTRKT